MGTQNGTGFGIQEHMIETYEPLMLKYQVDACLWGHVHKYERTCSMINYECDPTEQSPVHFVIGMAGNNYQEPWNQYDGYRTYQPDWSAFRTENFGYTTMETTAEALTLKYYATTDGLLHDEWSIS